MIVKTSPTPGTTESMDFYFHGVTPEEGGLVFTEEFTNLLKKSMDTGDYTNEEETNSLVFAFVAGPLTEEEIDPLDAALAELLGDVILTWDEETA